MIKKIKARHREGSKESLRSGPTKISCFWGIVGLSIFAQSNDEDKGAMKVIEHFRRFSVPVLFLFLLLFTTPALGIEWTVLSTTSDGNELSYDKKSVREVDSHIFRLWERIVYADSNVKERVKTTLFIREINCQHNRQRIISLMDYNAKGEKLFHGTNEQAAWSAIPPDTPLDLLRKKVCQKTISFP